MSFKDIAGQDRAVNFLRNSIKNGKVSGAYIFYGPRGVGKKFTALNFAKTLNCAAMDAPCDICPSCRKIESGSHPDVKIIAAERASATVRSSDIDGLISDIALKPYEGKKIFYIIDNADEMSHRVSTILLKTLEEPPKDVVLILIARNLSRLLPTIRSRSKLVKFFTISAGIIERLLAEKYHMDPARAALLARISSGSLSEALNLDSEKFNSKRSMILDILLNHRFDEFELDKAKVLDPELVLNTALTLYRDILVVKSGFSGIINADRRDAIYSEAARMDFLRLERIVKEIFMARKHLDMKVNQKLIMTTFIMELA